LRRKSGEQDGKQLPPDEKREKQQTEKLFVMILNQGLGPDKKRDGQAGNKNCAEQARDGEAQKIEAAAFLAQAVAKNAPAEPGDKTNLFEEPGTSG